MISANDLRNGTLFAWQGNPWKVLKYQQHFKARGRGKVSIRARNLKDGSVRNLSFQSSDSVDEADVENRQLTFRYQTREEAVFADSERELTIPVPAINWELNFLTKGEAVWILLYQDRPIGVKLPPTVRLTVNKTDPGVKGDTVGSTLKPARLSTGLTTKVPLFINEGDKIMVDTEKGEYRGRA